MKIYVRDLNPALIEAFENSFHHYSIDDKTILGHDITFARGDILAHNADALVSPANSFGYMDGGVDLHYVQKIGWHLQADLQKHIKANTPFNEVYIGQAVVIPTKDTNWPWLISAPTMRLPSRIPDHNIFLAARAAMHEAIKLNVSSVLFPGMGTGVGKVDVKSAANAMLTGIYSAIKGTV